MASFIVSINWMKHNKTHTAVELLHKRSSESLILILIQNHIKKVFFPVKEETMVGERWRERVRQSGFKFYANDAEIRKEF
jgi:hypothetical protein